MVRVILVMHAPLGAAFSACAEHILGEPPRLTVFDIEPDDEPDIQVQQLSRILTQEARDGALILCDIFGATPFNVANRALKLANERGVVGQLVTGTNLCMVLKALTDQQEDPEALGEKVRLGALKGIVNADQVS